jgi:hypothetical protein
MTQSDRDILAAYRRARYDPVIAFTSIGLRCVDHLFFGAPADTVWNWLCGLQSWRYRQLIPLPPSKRT